MASELAKEALRLYAELGESQHRSKENYNVMINLMDEFERMRLNWAESVEKVEQKDHQIYQLERDIEDRDGKIKTLQAELKDARSQVRDQLVENNALKSKLEDSMKRLKVVQELIKEHGIDSNDPLLDLIQQPLLARTQSLRTASHNTPEVEDDTTSSIDYDHTDDSICDITDRASRRSRGFVIPARERRSTSLQSRPIGINSKRSRANDENDHLPPKRSRDASKPPVFPQTCVKAPRRLATRNRSMSESSLAVENDDCRLLPMGLSTPKTSSNFDLRSAPRPKVIEKSWTRNGLISSRQHTYERINSYLKFTNCDVCNSSINFAAKPAAKCIDCQQIVHVNCKRRLAIPCVPRIVTPMKGKKDAQLFTLAEFCPTTTPMIPGPLIHLVTALEQKGLDSEGIYRVPGAKAQVSRTLNELRTSRGIPNLSMQHVEVLGDCIKLFLRELRDPLIPKSSRDEFIRAARNSDRSALNTAVCELPKPNRETLAYLIIHWQKVVALSDLNKMPRENIARCVSMSVIGQKSVGDIGAANKETSDCETVLRELLAISSQYWMRFLSENSVIPPTSVQPERSETLAANSSMLGPVTGERRGALPPTPRRNEYFAKP